MLSEGEPRRQNRRIQQSSARQLPSPSGARFKYLINDIPYGTSRLRLTNSLLAPFYASGRNWLSPNTVHPASPYLRISDSRLDITHSIAFVDFVGDIPEWLQYLNQDPYGFPKRTAVGTMWKRVDLIALDKDGRTEYIRAAMADHPNLQYITALAEVNDVNINIQDSEGKTALHWACAMGFSETVSLCLSVPGCDIGLRDNENRTAQDVALLGKNKLIPTLFAGCTDTLNFSGDEPVFPVDEDSTSTKLTRHKLTTAFCDGSVIHRTYKTDLATGQRMIPVLTKWTDRKILGSGRFGTVVLQQAEGGQFRAVKKILKGFGSVDYSRELKALSKVTERQDLFVQLFGWYENPDIVFIAMEYIEHGDLSQYLKETGFCSDEHAREITRQLLEGLVVLHGMGICHRDLKPQNVLIASLNPIWVKIADFGVSKYTKGTALYTRIGTQGYLAPEILGLLPWVATRNTYSNAVDMWAFGSIVHEVLTKEIPFLEARNLDSRFSGLTLDNESEDELIPETDLDALKAFCDGTTELPTDCLRLSGVSHAAIEFVKTVLVAKPEMRATGKEALQSKWLCSELTSTACSSVA